MRRLEFLDHPGPIPFAHRGGRGNWPENSWPAFENAVGLGYRYLETDVRATSDGVVLLLHDETLERVTDSTGSISSLTYREAAGIRLRSPETVHEQGAEIPRLDQLLDRWPDIRLNIDIKEPGAVAPTVDVIRRANAVGRVCVTSFRDATIRQARSLLGENLCVGGGTGAVGSLRLQSLLPTAAQRGGRLRARVDVVQVPTMFRGVPVCDARFVRCAARLGLPVHAWTINDADEMERLLALGVEGLITDYPETLKSHLISRGQWWGSS
ncbi:glycerophosphodiester phosphodiesterase [Parafrankia sp. EUN1f]|uniref:glycerophosphodiester phosphodiesterase n=1 Tax=Parafrankia sp. EUN1f TaxID=102897 RepID=UPI0001C441E1|nr:glycerophosphodiester phosphodiesterase [Parafrankia sp. EUN1f]EFC86060.1 glycerophosphoryl diester phosphodiesterase [Parafrankia sp. EUN1f]